MLINYYYILGVSHTATYADIKRAYRSRAKLWHPDVNRSSNAKLQFQLLNEAYHILIDSEKRQIYDHKWKTRYGISFINRKQSGESHRKHYYKAYTSPRYKTKKDETIIERTNIDFMLYITLLIIGGITLVMSIFRLFYEEWEGIDSVSGVLMGVWMLFLLVYGWKFIVKANKK